MESEPLVDVLRTTDPSHRQELDALAARLVEEARQPAREAVAIWRGSDPELSRRAMMLIRELDELALVPLLETAGTNTPGNEALLLRRVAAVETDLRKKVAARIDKLLSDRRPVPSPPQPLREEETAPPRRVCDEAYLLMRRFVSPSENQSQYYGAANEFLNLPESQRDVRIRDARQSPLWRQWLEDADE